MNAIQTASDMVDDARTLARMCRQMMRMMHNDSYWRSQVERHLKRARHWQSVQRKDESNAH